MDQQTISLHIFKGCLPQTLLGPFLSTLYHIFFDFLLVATCTVTKYSPDQIYTIHYYRYTELWFIIQFHNDFPRQRFSSLDFINPKFRNKGANKNEDFLKTIFFYRYLWVCTLATLVRSLSSQ